MIDIIENVFHIDPPWNFEERVASILPWLHESGNPYWDWLWGSPQLGRSKLIEWLGRPDSELSERRVRYLQAGDRIIGGYIALQSSELKACRRADFLALAVHLRRAPQDSMLTRLRQSQSIFSAAEEKENLCYLTRLGINVSDRSRGFARQLLDIVMAENRAQGIDKLQVDVFANNTHAIRLYHSAGFQLISSVSIPETNICYQSMLKILQ
jgi:GNAT superfamily N-acetyltransferase